MVAGVTPGKGGTASKAFRSSTPSNARLKKPAPMPAVIYVPPPFAADAILEAADAGIALIICITEGVPVRDMVKVKRYLDGTNSQLLGPICPGTITPGECKIGIMPGHIHRPGKVGVVSRSGTLDL